VERHPEGTRLSGSDETCGRIKKVGKKMLLFLSNPLAASQRNKTLCFVEPTVLVPGLPAGNTTEDALLLYSPLRRRPRTHRCLEPLCYQRASPNYPPRLSIPHHVNPAGARYDFVTDDANETTPPPAVSRTSLKAPLTLPEYKVEVMR